MKRTTKKLTVISLLSFSTLCCVVLFETGKINVNRSIFAKASQQEYSLSFSRNDAYSESDKTYVYEKPTSFGNPCYLVSTGGNSRSSGYLATIPSMYDSGDAVTLKFYKDSNGTIPFRQQSIETLSIKTSANVTLSIQTSSDGITFREKGTLNCTSSGASFSLFDESDRFLLITESARVASARSIKEVELTYTCESKSEYFTSGSYEAVVKDNSNLDAPMSIYFNYDNYGYYKFFYNGDSSYYYTLFTWQYDENLGSIKMDYTSTPAGSIADLTATGNSTNYSGYRLFARFGAGWTNYAAVLDSNISIYFHTSQAAAGTPNQYQRSTPTILSAII